MWITIKNDKFDRLLSYFLIFLLSPQGDAFFPSKGRLFPPKGTLFSPQGDGISLESLVPVRIADSLKGFLEPQLNGLILLINKKGCFLLLVNIHISFYLQWCSKQIKERKKVFLVLSFNIFDFNYEILFISI